MDGAHAIINLGELSKPATVLVEKIAEGIGGIARPWQITRVAEAQAKADKIQAITQIEISELQRRAVTRLFAEEARKQNNIESITAKALPELNSDAKPQDIEADWITNFFDKCRLISDEEMQNLWARVLSGEANSPGRFSKRTIGLLASLDKSDAKMFSSLCRFTCSVGGQLVPVITNYANQIYAKNGIDFVLLTHLEAIGLIRFNYTPKHIFSIDELAQEPVIDYFGRKIAIHFDSETDNELTVGQVLFTQAGEQLFSICEAKCLDEFFGYLNTIWRRDGALPPLQTEPLGGRMDGIRIDAIHKAVEQPIANPPTPWAVRD
jgi:hypothetical protein